MERVQNYFLLNILSLTVINKGDCKIVYRDSFVISQETSRSFIRIL